jgi:wyosine [tRNA(Phe)-imidazoG37] synthetase (radical SAM superfamily)
LSENEAPDFLTLSGSGEPTLNSQSGDVIRGIKDFSDVPIAVLTNSSLMWKKEVQDDIAGSDLVVPSLDAGSERVFEQVNRPHSSLSLGRVVDGMRDFSSSFEGDIWLEVMLVSGMNDGDGELELISDVIAGIDPQKVQLNTVIRPPSESYARPISEERMGEISRMLGAEIIADFKSRRRGVSRDLEERLLSLLKRRPCTLRDISGAMGIHPNEAIKYLEKLVDAGKVQVRDSGAETFYVHDSG